MVVHCLRNLNFEYQYFPLNLQSLDQFVDLVGQKYRHQLMLESHCYLLLFHHLVLVDHPEFTIGLNFLLSLVPLILRFQIAQQRSRLLLRRLHCYHLLFVPILSH